MVSKMHNWARRRVCPMYVSILLVIHIFLLEYKYLILSKVMTTPAEKTALPSLEGILQYQSTALFATLCHV